MVGFEKALGAVKVIKYQIQYRSQSLFNLARGYFRSFSIDLHNMADFAIMRNLNIFTLLKSLHFILAQSENSIIATACPLKFS